MQQLYIYFQKIQLYKPSMVKKLLGKNSWESILIVLVKYNFKQVVLNNVDGDIVKTKLIFRLHKSSSVSRS